jgi:hypothetical protein
MIQGLRSKTSPKKSGAKAKPSAPSRPLGSRAEGFAKADFFGASPVASALDLRNGRDPDTQTITVSCSFRSAGAAQDLLLAARNFFVARTCRIHPAQVKR